MKLFTTILLALHLYSNTFFAQNISGLVTDKETHEPLAYVNVGLIGKNVGTVSDPDGRYNLSISEANNKDTIKFSFIGYESITLPVKTFLQQYQSKKYNVSLLKKNITLDEVVVNPRKLIYKKTGNQGDREKICKVCFNPNNRGTTGCEIGATMKIKKGWTYIKNANFHFGFITEDSILFRVNVYNLKNGIPDSNLLTEPIYFTTKLEQGMITVDLTPHNIIVYDNFFISLEWIDSRAEGRLCVSVDNTKSFKGDPSGCYERATSQDKWRDFGAALKFYCNVGYEKK